MNHHQFGYAACVTLAVMQARPFVSYAREDRLRVRELCDDLRFMGADPWLDEEQILGGQDWERSINEALRSCSHVIVVLSHASVNKTGYVQKEVSEALAVLERRPPGDVFIIPVRLDHAEPRHDQLRRLQWIDVFTNYGAGIARLAKSLGVRPERIAAFEAARERKPPLKTSLRKYRVKSKMSLAQLAQDLGITEDHLAAIESARVAVEPTEAQISLASRALGCGFVEMRTPDDETGG